MPETIHCLQWHAEAIDKLYDQSAPVGDDAMAVIVREPLGVVGCVVPWNFPLMMLAWKIGPALAGGNSVIVKPAEQTSITALRVAELAHQAGVPRGVLNVVTGDGPSVGEPLGRHAGVDMVSFTGATEVGRAFLRYSADSNLKRIVLECGGKNPFVVLDDAEDLDLIADHLLQAAFWNMGENCSANSRLIVHEDLRDALITRVLVRARAFSWGRRSWTASRPRPRSPAKRSSARCSPSFRSRGTSRPSPWPTIPTTGLPPRCFPPTASAIRAARNIRAGTVTVNCYGEGDITTPFGGYKVSGFGGRDNSLYAHDQYTELKTIWIDLSDRGLEESLD